MSENSFVDSAYKFTSPIRYFKSNDPYYWEVDNIPLKQLAENNEWLKDQISGMLGISGAGSTFTEIDRSGFSELKPYVNGYDNIIRVKAGRYTARINDAYSITPLQMINQVLGFNLGEINMYQAQTINSVLINPTLQRFKSIISANALNMNGLAERSFTYPVKSLRRPASSLNNTIPIGTEDGGSRGPIYPNETGFINYADLSETTFNVFQYNFPDIPRGFDANNYFESVFVQRFRGAVRTAIVDVPNELSIPIPAFDPEDTTYTAEDGTVVNIPATQRVDLVFIYSKPIDASSTTISKFVNGTPTTLTTPILGIVRGAGLGVDFKAIPNGAALYLPTVTLNDANGTPKILPSVADENCNNIGLQGIKGSFPSPDDLMNIAPLLAENLESNNYALIGQSILPVAYVAVRQNAVTNETWGNILQSTDIIDIRPFFRTTELAYNERAGIAAAMPQVSFANPVATEGYVDVTARNLVQDYVARINGLPTGGTPGGSTFVLPRVVSQGYIRGGYNYGVEGALAKMLNDTQGLTTKTRQINAILQRYNLPLNTIISDLPDWDIATWLSYTTANANPGLYPNDRINFFKSGQSLTWASYLNQTLDNNARLTTLQGGYDECFITKTIALDRTNVGWMGDYEVNVKFWNCSIKSVDYSVFISKQPNQFTIFILLGRSINSFNHNNDITLRQNAVDTTLVMDAAGGMFPSIYPPSEPKYTKIGACTYPTVSFEVIGIPTGYAGINSNLNGTQPILSLA